MRGGKIPDAVLQRMAQYLRQVLSADPNQTMFTSSQLGSLTGLGSARVRNDFHYFGEFGMPGRGYERDHLLSSLEHVFGLDRNPVILLLGSDPLTIRLLKNDACSDGFHLDIRTEPDLSVGIAA